MRVLTDEPFVPDPGSIFHMQEIIMMVMRTMVTMEMKMRTMVMMVMKMMKMMTLVMTMTVKVDF